MKPKKNNVQNVESLLRDLCAVIHVVLSIAAFVGKGYVMFSV